MVVRPASRSLPCCLATGTAVGGGMGARIVPLGLRPVTGWADSDSPFDPVGAGRVFVSESNCNLGCWVGLGNRVGLVLQSPIGWGESGVSAGVSD